MFELIGGDIRAKAEWNYGSSESSDVLKTVFTDGTFAMICYRLMQASHKAGLAPLAMLFNKLNVWFGGCIIGRGADFGPRLVLIHSQGVVINSAVKAGSDVKIEHQVTVGAEKGASPVIGNDVFIGAGAKIIGGIAIGDGARIGANAVVLQDVPPDSTAVGVPAEIRG